MRAVKADPPIEANENITSTQSRPNCVSAADRYPATALAAALNADPSYKSQNGSFNRSHSPRAFEPRSVPTRVAAKDPSYKGQVQPCTRTRVPRDPSGIFQHTKAESRQPSISDDKGRKYNDQMRPTRSRNPRDPSIIMGGVKLSEGDDLDVDMEIAPPLQFRRVESSRPGAAFIDSRGMSTRQPTHDHLPSENFLASVTPEKESAAEQRETVLITKIRQRRQLIFAVLVIAVIAISLSVTLPLIRKSDDCCDGNGTDTEDPLLPPPQQNGSQDYVPAGTNSTGEDDGSSGNQPTESTVLPTPELSTKRPVEWIKLGQDPWIRDSEDVNSTAVAISRNGLTFALGAWHTSFGGQVFIYKYENAYWKMIAEIVDNENYTATGKAVALDDAGSIVAVGSPVTQTRIPSNSTGLVRVYRIIDDYASDTAHTAVQMGSDIRAQNDEFGWSVDLSSNGAIVAIGVRQQCTVRVMQFNESAQDWFDLGQLIECGEKNVGGVYDHRFGTAISLSSDGTHLAVGEPFGQVQVFMYDKVTNKWTSMGQAIDGETEDYAFGTSLSLSADAMTLAVGSPFSDASYSTSQHSDSAIGSCRVFHFVETQDSWIQLGRDIVGESPLDFFGTAVALSASGNIVAVGAVGSDNNSDDSGHVSVLEYDAEQNMWNPVGSDIPGPFASDGAGMSVALSAWGNIVTVPSFSAGMATVQVFERGAVPSSAADFQLMVAIHWNHTFKDPNEIRWFAERLDVEKRTVAAMEATASWWEFTYANGSMTSNMTLVEGGVYRFVFTVIDQYDEVPASFLLSRVDGSREIVYGNEENTTYSENSFLASSSGELETAIPAGNATSRTFVTLQIDFDEHPSDVHWVLLARSFVIEDNEMKVKRTVLAFGPKTVYGNDFASSTYRERIDVSLTPSGSSLKFFFTDTGRDGLCCSFGTGSYRIYNGTSFISTDELVSGSAEGLYREVQEFTLIK